MWQCETRPVVVPLRRGNNLGFIAFAILPIRGARDSATRPWWRQDVWYCCRSCSGFLTVLMIQSYVSRIYEKLYSYTQSGMECLFAYTSQRVRVIVAFVNTSPPYTSSARNSVIARDFRLSAWFAGLHFMISTVSSNEDLIRTLHSYRPPVRPHVDGTDKKRRGGGVGFS
jgi:hypothetical protein